MRVLEGCRERSALMREKVGKIAVIIGLSVSVFLILWITLFSRIGSDSRNFYPPFWSYRAIINGSGKALYEVVGNIILFFPVGVIAGLILGLSTWHTMFMGFSISLLIESLQWFFWLGSFEIDDLIHNTIGAMIGAFIFSKTQIHFFRDNRKRNIIVVCGLVALFLSILLLYQNLIYSRMKQFAALSDREDGTVNLLVLNGEEGFVGNTEVYILYNDDGTITIDGEAKSRGWKLLGKISLSPGQYSFTGLQGTDNDDIVLEIEYLDRIMQKYQRLTPDIRSGETENFEIQSDTRIRVSMEVFPGTKTNAIKARPVIYREDK